MAEAKVSTVSREVKRIVEEEQVTLTMSREEAEWLRALVGLKFEFPERTRIRKALDRAGVRRDSATQGAVREEVKRWTRIYFDYVPSLY